MTEQDICQDEVIVLVLLKCKVKKSRMKTLSKMLGIQISHFTCKAFDMKRTHE